MKGIELFAAFGGIDDKFIAEDAEPFTVGRSSGTRRVSPLKWAAAAAACLVMAAGILMGKNIIFAPPGGGGMALTPPVGESGVVIPPPGGESGIILTPPGSNAANQPEQTADASAYDALSGLPADNFSLADINTGGAGAETDRSVWRDFSDMFAYGAPHAFAFARAVRTEQWSETVYGDINVLRQDSSVQIISVLWSRGDGPPETMTLSQNLYGGCVGDEKTNLLREGGVYLLPLDYWQERWYIAGDLDVLFEVDDGGRVWTHSPHEGFSRFDGQSAGAVAAFIIAFTSDENFSAAFTQFGKIARHWGVLAEVSVLSAAEKTGDWGEYWYGEGRYYDYCEYGLRVDGVLSGASSRLRPEAGDVINVISYASRYLEQSGRYLLFLDPSEGGPFIEPERTAKINGDGTIAAIAGLDGHMPYTNVFEAFNGYTAAQMKEEAERAKAWQETHIKQ